MRSYFLSGLLAGTLVLFPPAARAGWGCPRFFSRLPQVVSLSLESDKVVFTTSADHVSANKAPCTEKMPPIPLTKHELGLLRPDLKKWLSDPVFDQMGTIEQNPISCVAEGSWIYFGIHFYESEGWVGAGGIGRFNPDLKSVEIRRPKPLRPYSVRKIVKRDDALWIATEDFNEGTRGPALGLVRFDWDQDRLETFRGKAPGPCGFWVNDLLLTSDELWVATELGISRYHFANGEWRHFVPIAPDSQELREASCREIYASVAATLPDDFDEREDGACDLDAMTPRKILRSLIKQYRPNDLHAVP